MVMNIVNFKDYYMAKLASVKSMYKSLALSIAMCGADPTSFVFQNFLSTEPVWANFEEVSAAMCRD